MKEDSTGHLYVLDWEMMTRHLEPYRDVLHFLFMEAALVTRVEAARWVRELSAGDGLLPLYERALGLPAGAWSGALTSYLEESVMGATSSRVRDFALAAMGVPRP
jgi:hypothetical protein